MQNIHTWLRREGSAGLDEFRLFVEDKLDNEGGEESGVNGSPPHSG